MQENNPVNRPSARKKIHFIINPASGTGRHNDLVDAVGKYMDPSRYECSLDLTDSPRHAILLARQAIESNADAIVARVNFYGWSLSGRRSLAEFFFNNLTNSKSMSGYTDVIFCPMHVTHLSQTLLAMLTKGLRGLYHVVGPEPMSKYKFGVEIARKFLLKDSEISPRSIHTSKLIARRAHNLYLSTHKLSTDLGTSLPSFSTGLDLFYTQFQQGYPQKLRSYAQ